MLSGFHWDPGLGQVGAGPPGGRGPGAQWASASASRSIQSPASSGRASGRSPLSEVAVVDLPSSAFLFVSWFLLDRWPTQRHFFRCMDGWYSRLIIGAETVLSDILRTTLLMQRRRTQPDICDLKFWRKLPVSLVPLYNPALGPSRVPLT